VRDVVRILPEGTRFPTLDAMLDDVATREAAALRTSETGDASLIGAFGLDVDVKAVSDAPIERYATIPPAARSALVTAGIRTMGELAKASPGDLAKVFQREAIAADKNDAAEWTAGARALVFTR
jgi:hypothetical protein